MRTLPLLLAFYLSVSAMHIQVDFEGTVDFYFAYTIENIDGTDRAVLYSDTENNPYEFRTGQDGTFQISVDVDIRSPGVDNTGTQDSGSGLFYQFSILSAPELISYTGSDAVFDEYILEYSYGYGVVGDSTHALIPNCGLAEYADPNNGDVKYLYNFMIDKSNVWPYLQIGDTVGFGECLNLPDELSGGVKSISLASLTVTNVIRFAEPPPETNVSEPSQEVLVLFSLSVCIPLFIKKHKTESVQKG